MSLIVLVDMRENNEQVVAISDEEGNIAQYDAVSGPFEIRNLHGDHPLNGFPWLIINLDDLSEVDEI